MTAFLYVRGRDRQVENDGIYARMCSEDDEIKAVPENVEKK